MSALGNKIFIYGAVAIGAFAGILGSYYLYKKLSSSSNQNKIESKNPEMDQISKSYLEIASTQSPDVSLLLRIMLQMRDEYIPILQYFPDAYTKLASKAIFNSSKSKKQKLLQQITESMRQALKEAEETICNDFQMNVAEFLQLYEENHENEHVNKLQKNIDEMIAVAVKGNKPHCKVTLPALMTPTIYLKIFRRTTAMLRQSYYFRMRKMAKESNGEISNEQLKIIADEVKKENIREVACEFYGISADEGESGMEVSLASILRKSYYVYMTLDGFSSKSDLEKSYNDKILNCIYSGYPIVGMERSVEEIGKMKDEELEEMILYQIQQIAEKKGKKEPGIEKNESEKEWEDEKEE